MQIIRRASEHVVRALKLVYMYKSFSWCFILPSIFFFPRPLGQVVNACWQQRKGYKKRVEETSILIASSFSSTSSSLSLQRKKNGNFSGQSCHLRSFGYNDIVVMHDSELGVVKAKIFREVLEKARSCRQFL